MLFWSVALLAVGSAVLLVVTDNCAAIQVGVPLPQEGLADGFQLSELQTDLLQVECAAVLDLPQWEWVHVHKGHAHQLPARNTNNNDAEQVCVYV